MNKETQKIELYPNAKELLQEIKQYDRLYSLEKYNIERKPVKVDKNKSVFLFPKFEEFNFWVKEYYMKNADDVEIVKNILKDDITINYKVTYDINRIEDIFNMYILNNYNNFMSVRKKSLQHILAIISESQIYKNSIDSNIDITEEREIFEELKKELNLDEKCTVQKLYKSHLQKNETYNAINEAICWKYRMNYFKDSMEAVNNAYDRRDEVLREIMGLPNDIKLKNTSELTLYKIIKDIFKDAIYQYRTEWLGRQSIDIYIPSKKIAFEYQGEQHYNPIGIFRRRRRTTKKKELR